MKIRQFLPAKHIVGNDNATVSHNLKLFIIRCCFLYLSHKPLKKMFSLGHITRFRGEVREALLKSFRKSENSTRARSSTFAMTMRRSTMRLPFWAPTKSCTTAITPQTAVVPSLSLAVPLVLMRPAGLPRLPISWAIWSGWTPVRSVMSPSCMTVLLPTRSSTFSLRPIRTTRLLILVR